jgi:hypothetical protein
MLAIICGMMGGKMPLRSGFSRSKTRHIISRIFGRRGSAALPRISNIFGLDDERNPKQQDARLSQKQQKARFTVAMK